MDEQLADRLGSKDYSKWGYIRVMISHYWVPQSSVLRPVLFNINNLIAECKHILRKFADNTKLGGVVEFIEGLGDPGGLIVYPDRLQGWATTNSIKFNACQILHLEWGNSVYTYRL